jgi:hypothetical protein
MEDALDEIELYNEDTLTLPARNSEQQQPASGTRARGSNFFYRYELDSACLTFTAAGQDGGSCKRVEKVEWPGRAALQLAVGTPKFGCNTCVRRQAPACLHTLRSCTRTWQQVSQPASLSGLPGIGHSFNQPDPTIATHLDFPCTRTP